MNLSVSNYLKTNLVSSVHYVIDYLQIDAFSFFNINRMQRSHSADTLVTVRWP